MHYRILHTVITAWLFLAIQPVAGNNCPSAGNIFEPLVGNGSLMGTVTDKSTGKPIEGAIISIPDLKLGTSSDKEGQYSFKEVPNGSFTIEVSCLGYKSFVTVVKINGPLLKDFLLSASIVEIDNVTITGVSQAMNMKRSALQVSVISKKELDQTGGSNLLDAFSKLPGVSVVSTGPAIAKPFIRGLGYNRVVTINDGIRQEGQQWGDEHGLEVDEYSVQKIEVIRGPASLSYGSDAMGGVINILTNTPAPLNTIRANFISSLNGNNRLLGHHANMSGNLHGFNWNAYGSFKNAGDYRNKFDGQVLNSRFNERNFGGYAGINKNWGYTHIIFSAFKQGLGMVEGERNESGQFILNGYSLTEEQRKGKKPLVPNQQVNHVKLAVDNSFSLRKGARITMLAGFQQNRRQEFGDPFHASEAQTFFDLKTITYSAAYHFPVFRNYKTSVGINGMKQQNKNRADEAIIPNYGLFDFGIYGYSVKTFEKTTLSGGLRFDLRDMKGQAMMEGSNLKFGAYNRGFSNFSASLGLSHEFNNIVSFKANVSKGFRAPNASELSANGEHEGTFRYEIGNTGLKSETSVSFDAGLQITTQHIDLTIAPFYNLIQDYIYYEKLLTGSGSDSLINEISAYRFTQQNAAIRGIELAFDLHPHPLDWLHIENTFSLVRGKFETAVDGSQNLPLMAPARLITELRAEFPNQLKSLKNIYVKLEMDNTGPQNHFFAGYHTETATNGYTLFNAGLGSDVEIGGKKRCSLYFTLNNFTNVAYQSHLSRLKYLAINHASGRTGVFNMGRNFAMRLVLPFEWSQN